ncbi:response regulator [Novosphingobium sp. FSY-8]|uniref:Response regulator n=1 Tax=Novosphingobium ovatum TaxID=1908523 RepID=A0ABW9XCC0_9SPHN|nr:response regulator transcription factor [Novosphingobium ovatum]NBC36163.1 response regulator [Novosphingobium ovatum]
MPMQALVVDDHPMCRTAARIAVLAVDPHAKVSEAASLAEALAHAPDYDILLLDLRLPDAAGLAVIYALQDAHPETPILVITGNEVEGLASAVRSAGASGIVSKTEPVTVLAEAVAKVTGEGGHFFTDTGPSVDDQSAVGRLRLLSAAERRVLLAMCDGSLNKQIAYRLGISEITVKQHVKAILRKLGVLNRTQAVLVMQASGGQPEPIVQGPWNGGLRADVHAQAAPPARSH